MPVLRRVLTLAVLLAPLPALAAAPAPSEAFAASAGLRAAVDAAGVFRHLEALQAIADRNGGNRAAGRPGYAASVDHVAAGLRAAGYAVTTPDFAYPFFEETAPPRLTVAGGEPSATRGAVRTLAYSAAGAVEAPLRPVDFAAPERANGSTSGCESSDFEGFPRGAVALLRRGTCPFQVKVANAAAAGATAAIVANDGAEGRTESFGGQLGRPSRLPAVAVGSALGDRLAAGGGTARLTVATRSGERRSRNLLAEAGPADTAPGRVVIVGAHLDGVAEGPGINDNGSGVAVVMEIAERLRHLHPDAASRVRFAFWGAEELGLHGSRAYLRSLPAAERGRIAAVLNFDMLGSPNYGRFVYDGDGTADGLTAPAGSAAVERLFRAYFRERGLAFEETSLGDDSDHAPFRAAGVAVGGLYAGAGERKSAEAARAFGGAAGVAFDACYHRACDRLDNVNRQAIDELADAAAHAVLVLARGLDRAGAARPPS